MPTLITNILISALLLAVFLVVRGLRGRVVGSVPHCRKCGFSLEGARADAPCPECGRDLQKIGAVRQGRFERRRASLVCGLVSAAVGVIGLAVVFFRSLDSLIPDLPTTAVVWASGSNDHELAGHALRELQDRAAAGELSDRVIREIAMQGIAARDEVAPGHGWFWPYAAFFDLAHERGLVSEAEWRDYAENSLYVLVIVNDNRQSVSVCFQHYLTNWRAGALSPITLDIEAQSLEYQAPGGEWGAVEIQSRSFGAGTISSHTASFNPEGYGTGKMARVRFKVRVLVAESRASIGEPWAGEVAFPLRKGLWTVRRKDGQEGVDIFRY